MYNTNMLEGKTILITGSSRGIGEATARLAKEYGAEVILHGKTGSEELKTLAKELDVRYIACDVASEKDVKRSVDELGLSKIDILVNCAGITSRHNFEEQTEEEWLDVYKVNVLGTVNFCKAVLPIMKLNKYGKIVNISSIRGYGMTSGRPAYSASKAAIINLTAVL